MRNGMIERERAKKNEIKNDKDRYIFSMGQLELGGQYRQHYVWQSPCFRNQIKLKEKKIRIFVPKTETIFVFEEHYRRCVMGLLRLVRQFVYGANTSNIQHLHLAGNIIFRFCIWRKSDFWFDVGGSLFFFFTQNQLMLCDAACEGNYHKIADEFGEKKICFFWDNRWGMLYIGLFDV